MADTKRKPITSREAVEKLNAMAAESDAEQSHSEADEILCDLLRSLGYGAVANAFEDAKARVGFWYA